MAAIFISHSSLDNALAGQLKEWLASEGYERVFLDFDKHSGLAAGEGWEARLYSELARCHAVILVVTPNWLESKWCFAEYTQARALGKAIFPVILSAIGSVSVAADIQSIDLRDWDSEGRAHLGRRLRLLTGEVARGFTWDHTRPPFPGMHAFDRGDSAVFFGRDPEIREVIERLEARRTQGGGPLLLVLGGSGSGKSSLMRAGVLETLARGTSHWIVLPTIRPQAASVEALAKAMAEAVARPADWRGWYDRLMSDDASGALRDFAREIRVGPAAHASVLLAVDQFEELYTVEAGATERPAFLRVLSAIGAGGSALPWQAIATARSDLLDQMMAHDGGARLVVETYALRPMPMDRVPSLIEGPATVGAVALERGFVERVQRDATTPETLPLLAVALRELYDRHGAERRFTIAQYEALGDPERGLGPLANAIRQKADRALTAAQATEAELAALRSALIPAVVRVDDSGAFLRQPARRSLMPPVAGRLVDVLTTARLLVAGGEDDADRIEVAHEALFTAWPLLRGWLEDERAFLQALARLDRAAALWEERANSVDYLLPSGAQLAEAEDIAAKRANALIGRPVMATFIAASSAAERQRQMARQREGRARLRRRIFYVAGGVTAVFAMLIVASFVAWQSHERETAQQLARASHLVAVVENLQRTMPHDRAGQIHRILTTLPQEPDKAVDILATTAHSRALLTEAILTSREIAYFGGLDGGEKEDDREDLAARVEDIASSADGRHVLSATAQTVRLWTTKPVPARSIVLGEAGMRRLVRISADGATAVTVDEQTIEIWDLSATPPRSRTVEVPGDGTISAVLSENGRWLAIGNFTGVHVLDVVGGGWRTLPQAPQEATVKALAMLDTGQMLVAGVAGERGFVVDAVADRRVDLGSADLVDVALASDGQMALTVSAGGLVETWKLTDRKPAPRTLELREFELRKAGKIRQALFDATARYILTLDDAARLVLWDVREDTADAMVHPLVLGEGVKRIERLDGGRRALALSYGNMASILDLTGTAFRQRTVGPMKQAILAPRAEVILVLKQSGDIAVHGSAASGDAAVPIPDAPRHEPSAVSRDGKVALTFDAERSRHVVWHRTALAWTRLDVPRDTVSDDVALSEDGTVLLVRPDSKILEVFDVGSGGLKLRRTIRPPAEFEAFAMSADGKVLTAYCVDGVVRLWKTADDLAGVVELTRRGRPVSSLSLDRAGHRLALADTRGEIEIWEVKGPPEIGQTISTSGTGVLELSADGNGLLIRDGGRDALFFEVFDLTTQEPTRIDIAWITRRVRSLAFDAEGQHLVAIDVSGDIYRWPVMLTAPQLLELARRSTTR